MSARQPPPGYRTQSEDTSYEIECMLFDRRRSMEAWEKLELASALIRTTRRLAHVGLRERWPNATEQELQLRAAAPHLGRELMIRVFGWDPDARGP